MTKKIFLLLGIVLAAVLFFEFNNNEVYDAQFVTYTANPSNQEVALYWKNDKNSIFGSLNNLKVWLNSNNKELLFAMNGGMYQKNQSPQGLFIQKGEVKAPIDSTSGSGNFYLKPNGIFYITNQKEAVVCKTTDLKNYANIKFATQSGPMLLVDGQIHNAFGKHSTNVNIRNGVGILPNHTILFAMSKKEINLYEFAEFFKNNGCKNALYLDGFVSRAYCPEANWEQLDGNFGVQIGVTKNK